MNILYLAFRNLIAKPLNLLLSLLLLVLSVFLVTFILQLTGQLNEQMNKNIAPFDMVVGAKGSPLQLVLSSVLHIDVPTGNIKLDEAKKIMKHPFVGTAVPVSYGDNFKGYRILGTELKYFGQYGAEIQSGHLYKSSFEIVAGSAVVKKLGLKIGDTVVSSHGLAAAGGEAHGDKPYTIVGILKPTGAVIDQLLVCNLESVWEAHDHDDAGEHYDDHGEHENGEHDAHDHEGEHDHDAHDHEAHDDTEDGHGHEDGEHDAHDHEEEHEDEEHDHDVHDHDAHDDTEDDHGHEDGEHDAHDHDEEHENGEHDHDAHDHEAHDDTEDGHGHEDGEHEHGEELEITSLLVKFKNPMALVQMPRFINENTTMQAALPGFEIQRLMGLLGSGAKTINGIAIMILFVSGLSIFISLLKTIRERRQELALLRTYGLGTAKLLLLVLLEGLFLALFGFLLGWSFGRLALVLASKYIESGYGYVLQINGPTFVELLLLGATLLISIIAVFLASTSIFKLNISKTLTNA